MTWPIFRLKKKHRRGVAIDVLACDHWTLQLTRTRSVQQKKINIPWERTHTYWTRILLAINPITRIRVFACTWKDSWALRTASMTGTVQTNLIVLSSDAVLAEILLRSPQKIFICIIKKKNCRVKVSKNKIISFWKKLHWCFQKLDWTADGLSWASRSPVAICFTQGTIVTRLTTYEIITYLISQAYG